VAEVINYQNVVYISEVCCDVVLMETCARCVSSRFCRKNSAMSPVDGTPIASPSCWIEIFPLLEK